MKHGMTRDPKLRGTLNSWQSMIQRCTSRHAPSYENYGGRGISVCERWRSFKAFVEDMGARPSLQHSIDRFPDKDGNYEPGNCRWATREEQANNRRGNLLITIHGETLTMSEWAKKSGVHKSTLYSRFKNHPIGPGFLRAPRQPETAGPAPQSGMRVVPRSA